MDDHSKLTKGSMRRLFRLGRVIYKPIGRIQKDTVGDRNDHVSSIASKPADEIDTKEAADELSQGANSMDSTVIIRNNQANDVPSQVFVTEMKSDPPDIMDHVGEEVYEPEAPDILPEFPFFATHSSSYRSQILGYIKGNLIAKLSPEKVLKTDWDYLLSHDLYGWPEELTRKDRSGKSIPNNPEFMTNKELMILENSLSGINFCNLQNV